MNFEFDEIEEEKEESVVELEIKDQLEEINNQLNFIRNTFDFITAIIVYGGIFILILLLLIAGYTYHLYYHFF